MGTDGCYYHIPYIGVVAERLSVRHLILQHALSRCMFVRHALLRMRIYVFVRHALYACARVWRGHDMCTRKWHFIVARCGWMADVKLHDQRQRIYSEPCMGRERINVILSSSHNVIYCARHISAYSAYTIM